MRASTGAGQCLLVYEDDDPCNPRLLHAANLLRAFLSIKRSLQYRSFAMVVANASVARTETQRSCDLDMKRASELVLIFRRLRPLLVPRSPELLAGFVGARFLLAPVEGVPGHRFGVRVRPFDGHCWLQIDRWS
jgi:hypothetical protein